MSGFSEYDKYDGLGLAGLVRKKPEVDCPLSGAFYLVAKSHSSCPLMVL